MKHPTGSRRTRRCLGWRNSERRSTPKRARWLLRAWRSVAHLHLGYGSFAQYIESLFGYNPRTIQEKLRVAEALERLPRVANALEGGALSWCAARELTRVGPPRHRVNLARRRANKTLRGPAWTPTPS